MSNMKKKHFFQKCVKTAHAAIANIKIVGKNNILYTKPGQHLGRVSLQRYVIMLVRNVCDWLRSSKQILYLVFTFLRHPVSKYDKA